MRRLRGFLVLTLLVLPALLAVTLAVLDTAAVDDYLVRALPRWASDAGYQLSLEDLDLEPWATRLTLDGVRLQQLPEAGGEGWEVAVRVVAVRLRVLQSLLGTPHLEVRLEGPRVRGQLPAHGPDEAGGGGGGTTPRVVLHTLEVTDGSVDIRDARRELAVGVSAIQVAWVQDAGGGSARDVRVRWRGGEEGLERIEFSGARRFATLRLDRLDLAGPRLRLGVRGRIGPWRLMDLQMGGELDLEGFPEPWLEALHLTHFAPLGGELSVAGRLKGSTRSPEFAGSLELRKGRFGTVEAARLSAQLVVDRNQLSVRNLVASSNVVALDGISGRLQWDSGMWLQARGRARDYRLRPFMGLLFPEHYFPVGLTADGEFQVEGPLYPELALAVRGEASVRDLDVTADSDGQRQTRFSLPAARLRTRATVKPHEIAFGPSRLETDSVDLDVSGGRIVYREGLWFSTVAEIRSLALTRPLLPSWLDARGKAEGQFGGPYRELEFTYDVDLAEVTVASQDLGRVRGRGEFDLRDLRVTDGHLSGPLGELFAGGGVTLAPGGQHDWDLRWEQGDLAVTAEFLRQLGVQIPLQLGGGVATQGRLAGPLVDPEYAGTADLVGLKADRFVVDQAHLEGRVSRAGWRVPRAELEAYGTRSLASGSGDTVGFRSNIEVAGLEVGPFLEEIQVAVPVDGVFEGRVQADGRYSDIRVAVSGEAVSARAYDNPLPDSEVTLALDRDALELTAAALGGRLEAMLRRDVESGDLTAMATAREVPWAALPRGRLPAGLTGEALSGTVELQVESSAQPVARWMGTGRGLRWRDLQMGEVTFEGSYKAGAVSLRTSAWDRSLRVEGLASPEAGAPVELELALDGFALSHLRPYIAISAGTVDGRGRVLLGRRQWEESKGLRRISALADLELVVDAKGLRDIHGLDLPDLQARVTSPDGRPRWRVLASGLELDGAVEDLDRGTWQTQARLDQFVPWPLLPLGDTAGELGGLLSGTGWLRGAGATLLAAEGGGLLSQLRWGEWGRSDWEWNLNYGDGRLTAALREPRGVVLNAAWEEPTGVELELYLNQVPLHGWAPESGFFSDLGGTVEGRGSLRWTGQGRPSGNLELANLHLKASALELANRTPVRISWTGEEVRLDDVALAGDGVEVTVAGLIEPLESWDLRADADLDLATLAAWLPQLERGHGRAELGLEVQGPWERPLVRGPVEIAPGAILKLAGVPIVLEDLDASGALEGGQRFTLDWLDAQVREGRLHLEGGLDLEQWRPKTLRFYSEIRDLDLQWPAQVEYRFDADALVTGTVTEPQVRGEVRLQEFLYSRSINWRRLILDALDRKPRQVESHDQGGVFVDLAVHGSDNIRVENNLAELELAADLRVRGYLANPVLWGRVDVVDGEISFRGRDYDALESTVEFLGETQPVPQLDLHAQTQTRDYTVNVDVTGPLDNYQVGLSSVPYLTHTDIVALLTLGMTSQEMEVAGNVAGAEAASILSEGLQEELNAVRGVFGVDLFHINPRYSPATQTTVPRVTLGKAVTEELFARYSAAVGAETEQNVELEYTLNPRVSLLGTWIDRDTQEQGSLGGEVRFRFPFR